MTGLVELARAVLAKGKSFRFHAPGLSMTPFIRDGDFVTIGPDFGDTLLISLSSRPS
jgi:hypothetical protein